MSKKKQLKIAYLTIFVIILLVLGGYSFYIYKRPVPSLLLQPKLHSVALQSQAGVASFAWPAQGQAAVSVVGSSFLASHGAQTTTPIASTAKVLTALSVLKQKPLELNQPGPTITLNASDVALYNSYVSQGGSVVAVAAGEQVSEYQMLQAMLLPSANNIADSLAVWAFGSLQNYTTYANNYAKTLGLTNTKVGVDASGFSPTTTSTASDLVLLGKAALENPVISQVVGQSTADNIPMVGTVHNVNALLGTNGIIGIKTGNTDQAGGVFLGASSFNKDTKTVKVITAVVGVPSLFQALQNTLPLITSAQNNFTNTTIISKQAVVGNYELPWAKADLLQAAVADSLTSLTWKGTSTKATVQLQPISLTARTGQVVGSIVTQKTAFAEAQTVPVVLKQAPSLPDYWWRWCHPSF